MWSYYGRKWKIIGKYPKPEFDTIIEPFAGTASYAYKHWEHSVVLVDAFDKIIRIWKYLQQANPSDILALPDVENGEFIGDKHLWMSDEERWLVGFSINNASPTPKHTAGRMNFNSWSRDKIRIANDLHKIRHWKFVLGDFRCLKNINATWYIDPPYQFQHLYKKNNINYPTLATWCRERNGQVIVCEQSTADWMDFKPLVQLSGQRTKTTEVIWEQTREQWESKMWYAYTEEAQRGIENDIIKDYQRMEREENYRTWLME